ncbi:hypothetical protein B0A48_01225 [Cryoendolithus antarcticus]|uniref:Uncharacterized protein n=1 Tax=Cryoendolithus antarcticus TaxID=1507870 RepID=A0A1V8TSL7_9PEZI|nr:hypothetical protein B0A48_01225 [Cryoendolithus antarcticus]
MIGGHFFRGLFPKRAFDGDVSGALIVSWYQNLFSNSTTYASILASVMFSSMIQDLDERLYSNDQRHQIRLYSAVGAVLFVCLVLLCQGFALGLKFHSRLLARKYDSKHRGVRIMLQVFSLLFQQLLLVGTVFFCLVVKVYDFKIGLAGLVTTWIVMGISLVSWLMAAATETRSQWKKWRGEPWTTAKSAQKKQKDADRKAAARAQAEAEGNADLGDPICMERMTSASDAVPAAA